METKPARSMILPRMVVTGPGVLEQLPAIIAELDIPERGLIVCDTNTLEIAGNQVIEYFESYEVLGELTIVIKGLKKDPNKEVDTIILKEELKELVKAGLSLSSAARYLAKKKNIPKSIIYNLH